MLAVKFCKIEKKMILSEKYKFLFSKCKFEENITDYLQYTKSGQKRCFIRYNYE